MVFKCNISNIRIARQAVNDDSRVENVDAFRVNPDGIKEDSPELFVEGVH
jgi:hypothetical protein